MNCRKVYRNLSAYHDKLLPQEKTRKLEQHLRECPECMQRWREFSEIVKATGYLQTHKPSADFNQRLLQSVATINFTSKETYEPLGGRRWATYALAFAGVTVALAIFMTFPFLDKNETEPIAVTPTGLSVPDQELDPSAVLSSRHLPAGDDSLWQLFEFTEADLFRALSPEMLAGETRVFKSYVLPLMDIEGESSYTGKSYLLTPVSSGGTQSTDVVF